MKLSGELMGKTIYANTWKEMGVIILNGAT
jgi:hypothetical protein